MLPYYFWNWWQAETIKNGISFLDNREAPQKPLKSSWFLVSFLFFIFWVIWVINLLILDNIRSEIHELLLVYTFNRKAICYFSLNRARKAKWFWVTERKSQAHKNFQILWPDRTKIHYSSKFSPISQFLCSLLVYFFIFDYFRYQ